MPDLFSYSDYRLYLEDVYREKKEISRYYSYQVMAEKMGFKSKDFVFRVIKGDRKLSTSGIAAMSSGLEHGPEESRYFLALVCFNQAKTAAEKEFYYRQLNLRTRAEKTRGTRQRLNQRQLELFSEWHHLAIRAVIEMSDFSDDYDWLARQLHPAISRKQAVQSVRHLEKLQLIRRDEKGCYCVSQKGLATDSEVESLSLVRFYNSCARLSTDALNNMPKQLRNISGVTLGISRERYLEITDRINSFRGEITALACEDDNADQVYQMLISLFPFTNPDRGRNQK